MYHDVAENLVIEKKLTGDTPNFVTCYFYSLSKKVLVGAHEIEGDGVKYGIDIDKQGHWMYVRKKHLIIIQLFYTEEYIIMMHKTENLNF